MHGMQIPAVILFALGGVAASAPNTAVIGIVDGKDAHCRKSAVVAVRPLFAKVGSSWSALDTPERFARAVPGEVSWTVAFDGAKLGGLRTLAPHHDVEKDLRDRLLTLAPGERSPRRAKPDDRFEGWCGAAPDRPLVVVTPSNFRDPDVWKPYAPSPTERAALFPFFKAAVDSVFVCPDAERVVRFDYAARDVRIVRAYRSARGQTIVALELLQKLNSCDGPPDDDWAVHWFVLGSVSKLLGIGLQLVDAGDYDADGRSELLFWYSGYNRDGYTLFSDDFRQRVDAWWGYH